MNIKKTFSIVVPFLLISGCASYGGGYAQQPSPYDQNYHQNYHYGDQVYNTRSNSAYNRVYGTVTSIQDVVLDQREYNNSALGVVIGGLAGGLIGHNVGKGTGRDLATIAGAVAGGVAGHQIQKNMSGTRMVKRINVRLDNGDRVSIMQPVSQVWVGARVYITGSGNQARVQLKNR